MPRGADRRRPSEAPRPRTSTEALSEACCPGVPNKGCRSIVRRANAMGHPPSVAVIDAEALAGALPLRPHQQGKSTRPHRHAHRVACALARWNGMRWNDTDTMMACTPPRWQRRRPGRVCCSRDECRASRDGCSRDRSDLCAQRSPSRLRSSGHAFQRFLRRSARPHTVTKTTAARAVARAQATRAATRDARSRRAMPAMGAPPSLLLRPLFPNRLIIGVLRVLV